MADEHTLSGLIRKRAEIAGRVEHMQDQLRQLVIDLDNVDATIRLFDPDIDLAEIKPKPLPPRHHAYRGELSRIILTTLRNAKKPLTTREIAQRVMAERGMNTADERLLRLMSKRTGACLRDHRIRGTVKSERGKGQYLFWQQAHNT